MDKVSFARLVAISISLVRIGHSEKVRVDHHPHKHIAGVKYENAKSP
jgi:triosephosphate isomerase